jgi:hypothetical protein
MTPERELEMLNGYKEWLETEKEAIEEELSSIAEDIQNLENPSEEDENRYIPRFPPFPAPPAYGPPPTSTQEREMLEEEASRLEDEIEGIKKKLEEEGEK